MKILLQIVIVLALFSCRKQVDEAPLPFPSRSDENPVAALAFNGEGLKPAFDLDASSTDYPTEYGLEFTVSKKGNLYALGLNVPDTGTYILSLWDVSTRDLLLRDTARYTLTNGFLYIDFGPAGKEVEIRSNKKYMASVFMPRSPTGATLRYYTLFQPGVAKWVPFTQKHVTVLGSFLTKTDAPAYPDIQVLHQDVLNGLVDIGYYATEY